MNSSGSNQSPGIWEKTILLSFDNNYSLICMICMQQMCKSCDNKVFFPYNFIQALPLLISCWPSFCDWTHLEDQKCEMIKHGQLVKTDPVSLWRWRKQTLAVCHCGLFQHKKTTSFIMLNICCSSIPMWPLLTSGIITHNKTQMKYYSHAILSVV